MAAADGMGWGIVDERSETVDKWVLLRDLEAGKMRDRGFSVVVDTEYGAKVKAKVKAKAKVKVEAQPDP